MPRHLIHVGFPKCASTALQGWFDAHPGIAFAYDRLAGYESAVGFARRTAVTGSERDVVVTSCEDFVIPLSDFRPSVDVVEQRRRVCVRLRALFPDAVVLIVTRGFRGLLASTYAHYVRNGGTLGRSQLFGHNDEHDIEYGVEDYFDYDAVITLYERVFGPERVLVMPYELLRDDARAFAGELEDRLDIPRSGRCPARLNIAVSPAELNWYPRFTRLAYRAGAPLGRYGQRIVDRYLGALDRLAFRRVAEALARVTPAFMNRSQPDLPSEVLDRCYPRARRLVARSAYAPYRAEYVAMASRS
jgi:hypothetical protein